MSFTLSVNLKNYGNELLSSSCSGMSIFRFYLFSLYEDLQGIAMLRIIKTHHGKVKFQNEISFIFLLQFS